MTFTEDQIHQFRTEGYLTVPDFWDAEEIAAMRAELTRLKEAGLLRNVTTAGDGATVSTTKANLQLCPMSPYSTLFRAMPFVPKVGEAVSALIGDPVLHHLDQVFIKPAKHGVGTKWHQDNAYFSIPDPLAGTALWTAVHDATAANGTLRVVPGAFAQALPHDRDPDSDHHIRCYPDETRAVTIEVPAGGAIFFCYGTPHATGENTTDQERAGIALHFINAGQNGTARAGFDPGKRPVISGAGATGGAAEHGVRIAGTWETEVAHALQGA